MTDTTYIEHAKDKKYSLVPDVFFHPHRAFHRISSYTSSTWQIPLIILSLFVLINVLAIGRLKTQAAQMGEITYPPDFQYYSPEQQAQYLQAIQSTQGPVFMYVLPAITSLLGVWFTWLILGGLLHLVTTLLGGRGNTAQSMNIVGWSSLALALRELVQIIYILTAQKTINNPGLSGFSLGGESGLALYTSQILQYIDIYLIWQMLLVILGVRYSTSLNKSKAVMGVLISFLILILLRSAASYLFSTLGNLEITRPFFF